MRNGLDVVLSGCTNMSCLLRNLLTFFSVLREQCNFFFFRV